MNILSRLWAKNTDILYCHKKKLQAAEAALDPDEARKLFQVMKNERSLEETEPITILQWWSKKHNHVWVGGDFDGYVMVLNFLLK